MTWIRRPTLTALLSAVACAAANGTASASPANPAAIASCYSSFEASLDTTGMQPKDFAMAESGGTWHLFYTRQHMAPNYSDATNTRAIGHAVSTDPHLATWTVVDRAAIQVREGRAWDNLHVWAPSIVRHADTWYLFHTGVQLDTVTTTPSLVTTEIQRIGIATSSDLMAWTSDPEPVLSHKQLSWTFQDSTAQGNGGIGWQLRDPFVMRDPDRPGNWLMYFVAVDSSLGQFVVGMARSVGGDLRRWEDAGPIRRTSAAFLSAGRVESPQVFQRNGTWWLTAMANHFGGQDQITYALNTGSPSDSAGWSLPDSLKRITCGEHDYPSSLNGFHAIERFTAGPNEMIGGFSRTPFGVGTVLFTRLIEPPVSCPSDSFALTCPDVVTGVAAGEPAAGVAAVELALEGSSPARSGTVFVLHLREPGAVVVAVHDLAGRRLVTLLDGERAAGEHRVAWDGRLSDGSRARSGVYFVRAVTGRGHATLRLPWLR